MEEVVSPHGTKRKRHEPPQQDISLKIGGKLYHGLKEVKKSAKKAKTFEIQKLIKKIKDLRKKSENKVEISDVERQLELIKRLDHDLIAMTAVKTKLNKIRILQENEYVQAAILKELISDVDTTAFSAPDKLQSRLLSSKILSAEINLLVENLKNILQPKIGPAASAITMDDSPPERPMKVKKLKNDQQTAPTRPLLALKKGTDRANEEESEVEMDVGWESGTVSGDETQDGWESGSSDEDGEDILEEKPEHNEREFVFTSASGVKLPPAKGGMAKMPGKATGIQSTFLPSLSVGFTRGESGDSDLSESEIKVADIDIKKNRRGQRARRAIWEKKFGKNANHKKKEVEQSKERFGNSERQYSALAQHIHHSKTLSRGLTDAKAVPQHRQKSDTGWGQRTAAGSSLQNSIARTVSHVGEKPIHPSWEAKKKLKEKERATILPSQGTKIRFS